VNGVRADFVILDEAINLDSLPAEERERILRDLFGEAENDCE
jgi:hypothetical protein